MPRVGEEFHAFRMADRRHPIFDGEGARKYGGRWNSPRPDEETDLWKVIYAAESLALAVLEKLVHTGDITLIPYNQVFIEIVIPADVPIRKLTSEECPGWEAEDEKASREYGDKWLEEGQTAVLLVPSVVVPTENNVVINQAHPDFAKIRHSDEQSVVWDKRLVNLLKR